MLKGMSDSELQSAGESSLAENLASPVTEWQQGNKRVRHDPQMIKQQLDAVVLLRALQSPRRGFNPVQIDRPA